MSRKITRVNLFTFNSMEDLVNICVVVILFVDVVVVIVDVVGVVVDVVVVVDDVVSLPASD